MLKKNNNTKRRGRELRVELMGDELTCWRSCVEFIHPMRYFVIINRCCDVLGFNLFMEQTKTLAELKKRSFTCLFFFFSFGKFRLDSSFPDAVGALCFPVRHSGSSHPPDTPTCTVNQLSASLVCNAVVAAGSFICTRKLCDSVLSFAPIPTTRRQ